MKSKQFLSKISLVLVTVFVCFSLPNPLGAQSTPNCVIDADFTTGTQGFSYIDSQNHPQYADGLLSNSGNPGQALELVLGGIDRTSYSNGNENSWEIPFNGGGTITITGDFNLIVARYFESDEYGEARLRLNGQLYGLNGQSYLAHLDGDSNNQNTTHTTGWTAFSISVPNLPDGAHMLQLAGYNNKKTRPNEIVQALFDNIEVCVTAATPDSISPTINITSPTAGTSYSTVNSTITLGGTSSDDQGVVAVTWSNETTLATGAAVGTTNWTANGISLAVGSNELVVSASDAAGNVGTDTLLVTYTPDTTSACVLDADFESGSEGFSYSDSPNHPDYASGSVGSGNPGQGLELALGNVNSGDYFDGNENSWDISFSGGGTVTISGDFNLIVDKSFESDEYGEARLRLDGQLYGLNGQNYLAHLDGDSNNQSSHHTTGWTPFSISVLNQPDVVHSLQLAAYNNKKTSSSEDVQVFFDNIKVCMSPDFPDTTLPVLSITNPTAGMSYSTENNFVNLAGTASDDKGVVGVNWSNETTAATGTAIGTTNWTANGISLAVGANSLIVSASDAAGNIGADTLFVTYTPDTTPPVISNVQSSGITSNSASVSWDTDEPGDSQVVYGFDTSYGSVTPPDTALITSHVVQLNGLAADTTYHFQVLSRDAKGNLATSSDFTFQTLPVPPDTEPPVVNLTSPACNSSIAGIVTVSATATDNDSVTNVEFYIDGTLLGSVTSAPYNVSWNTTQYSDSTHTVLAVAYDAAGNQADDSCDVMVNNLTPACVVDADFESGSEGFSYSDSPNHPDYASGSVGSGNPGQGLELALGNVNSGDYFDGNENSWDISFSGGGTVTISGDFNLIVDKSFESDEYGEARLRLDGQLYGLNGQNYLAHLDGDSNNQSSHHTTGWTPFSISVLNQPDVIHSLQLTGYNNKKTSSSEVVQTFFDNIKVCLTPAGPDLSPPAVSIESPTSGSSYLTGSSTESLGGTASDDRGVVAVTWQNLATSATGSALGTTNWSVNGVSLVSGLNELVVSAYDAAGNVGTDTLAITYDPNLDTDPPVISNVTVDSVTSSIVTITWNTDEPSDSQVEYGLTIVNQGMVKIMPLGDSITDGKGSNPRHGFREDLYDLLTNAGYDFDFVGSLTGGSGFDTDHEGHSGFYTQTINSSITTWVQDTNPDVVIYHIGTNDITAVFSFSKIINDITSTLNKIWAVNPNIWVIQSQITPRSDLTLFDTNTTILNGMIDDLVQSLQSGGSPISIVDHNSAFKANPNWANDYMNDGKHPNSAGYDLMANIYFQGLQNVLGNGSQTFSKTPLDPTLVTAHSVTFNSLRANTSYTYRVISADAFGNTATSPDFAFLTAPDGSISADFASGSNGFTYEDSQNHAQYADGYWLSGGGNPGGNLELVLGGVDNNSYSNGNENVWKISFTGGGDVTVSGDFNLFVAKHFESDEHGEARLRVNGQLYGMNGQNYLAHLDGDSNNQSSNHTTGWTPFSITIFNLPYGTHELKLAGYNNKKTRANEIVQVNFDNIYLTISGQTTAFLKTIADEFDTLIPLHNEILGNYPNPFNPSTKFMFSIAEDAEVQIKVYNIIGQEVATLLDDWKVRGITTVEWDGRNALGRRVASGIYIIRLRTRNWSAVHKINLAK